VNINWHNIKWECLRR